MRKITVSILLLALSINAAVAQITYEKVFGGTGTGGAVSAIQTFDGGTAVAGYIYANGITGIDLSLVKFDANGNIIWNKTYGGLNQDYTNGGFQQTSDSGFIILGYNESYTSYNSMMLKLNASGDTMWTRTFSLSSPYDFLQVRDVHQTKDGGYILVGTYYEEDSIDANYAFLAKTNGNGDITWSNLYSNENPSYEVINGGDEVLETANNGFIMIGYGESTFIDTSSFGYEYDIDLYETDAAGNIIWVKEINIDASSEYAFLQQDNGGYALTGELTGYSDSTYLLKTDLSGNLLWAKKYFSTLGTLADANLYETTKGEYILSGGLMNNGETGTYAHLIKTDNSGDTLWTRRFGPSFQNTQLSSIFQNADNSYLAAGVTEANAQGGISNMYIVKTDSIGNTKCDQSYNLVEVNSFSIAEMVDQGYTIPFNIYSSSWNISIGNSGADNYQCSPDAIASVTPLTQISLYPNPAHDIINIDVPSNAAISSIEVFDVTGRKIYSQNISAQSTNYMVDMGGNVAGYYFVQLNSSKETINRSFILE